MWWYKLSKLFKTRVFIFSLHFFCSYCLVTLFQSGFQSHHCWNSYCPGYCCYCLTLGLIPSCNLALLVNDFFFLSAILTHRSPPSWNIFVIWFPRYSSLGFPIYHLFSTSLLWWPWFCHQTETPSILLWWFSYFNNHLCANNSQMYIFCSNLSSYLHSCAYNFLFKVSLIYTNKDLSRISYSQAPPKFSIPAGFPISIDGNSVWHRETVG